VAACQSYEEDYDGFDLHEAFSILEALPKTPSGKIQRFILRNQELALSGAGRSSQ
jgi:acyl-coenzyme A synthetase/AMP-(fatty) acid ligase